MAHSDAPRMRKRPWGQPNQPNSRAFGRGILSRIAAVAFTPYEAPRRYRHKVRKGSEAEAREFRMKKTRRRIANDSKRRNRQ